MRGKLRECGASETQEEMFEGGRLIASRRVRTLKDCGCVKRRSGVVGEETSSRVGGPVSGCKVKVAQHTLGHLFLFFSRLVFTSICFMNVHLNHVPKLCI